MQLLGQLAWPLIFMGIIALGQKKRDAYRAILVFCVFIPK